MEIVQEALSKSRRRGKVLLVKGQPEDHPFPLALTEMRYLKFVYLQTFKD
jgi:23S rRNA (cytosine1962-C5)-methyltransferase